MEPTVLAVSGATHRIEIEGDEGAEVGRSVSHLECH